MRFFYDNEIDKTGSLLTASSSQTNLPAGNVINELKTKVWRTGTATATETLIMDLGSAKTITGFIVHGHNLTSGDSNIKLEGNNANVWGAPAFTQALTYAANTIGQVFAGQTFRYWRLSFTKSAAGETRDIGRIFIGSYYESDEQPNWDGYSESVEDVDRRMKSLGGQVYSEIVNGFQVIRTDFTRVNNAMMAQFKTIYSALRRNKSFFIQIDTVSPLDGFIYVKFLRPFRRDVQGFDTSYYWGATLEFEEQV